MARLLILRYDAVCARCGRDLAPGERAWVVAPTRECYCLGCHGALSAAVPWLHDATATPPRHAGEGA